MPHLAFSQVAGSASSFKILPAVDIYSPWAYDRQIKATFDNPGEWQVERSLSMSTSPGGGWFPIAENAGFLDSRMNSNGQRVGLYLPFPVMTLPQRFFDPTPQDSRNTAMSATFVAYMYPRVAVHPEYITTQVRGWRKSKTPSWTGSAEVVINLTSSQFDLRQPTSPNTARWMETVVLQPPNLSGQTLYLTLDAWNVAEGDPYPTGADSGDPQVVAQVRTWLLQAGPDLRQKFNVPYPITLPIPRPPTTADERSFFRLRCFPPATDANDNGVPDAYEATFSDVFISEACFFNTNGAYVQYKPNPNPNIPAPIEYCDWIELYNPTPWPVNLCGDVITMTDATTSHSVGLPEILMDSGKSACLFCSGIPTADLAEIYQSRNIPYKLKNGGETITFRRNKIVPPATTPTLCLVDTFYIPGRQAMVAHPFPNISFGRCMENNLVKLRYFGHPTFATPNPTHGATYCAQEPQFIDGSTLGTTNVPLKGGLKLSSESVLIALTRAAEPAGNVTLLYTLDGSEPTAESFVYTAPFPISRTTVVRARAFRTDGLPSASVSRSFIFPEDVLGQPFLNSVTDSYSERTQHKAEIIRRYRTAGEAGETTQPQGLVAKLRRIPSISICLSPAALANPNIPFENAIYQSVGGSFEWINPDAPAHYTQENCKIERVGESSISLPKGSFELTFNKTNSLAGKDKLSGPVAAGDFSGIFPTTKVTKFAKLRLRNGFWSSWAYWKENPNLCMADAYYKETARAFGQFNVERRFVHVYINGTYSGVYDLEEKLDEDMIVSHKKNPDLENDSEWRPENILLFNWGPQGGPANVNPLARDRWDQIFRRFEAASASPNDANFYTIVTDVVDMDDFIAWLMAYSILRVQDWTTSQFKGWCRYWPNEEGLGYHHDKLHFFSAGMEML